MERKASRLAEVQVARSLSLLPSPSSPAPGAGTGATIGVPAGFDAEEVLLLLTVVREALR